MVQILILSVGVYPEMNKKAIFPIMKHVYLKLFNAIFDTGFFPEAWAQDMIYLFIRKKATKVAIKFLSNCMLYVQNYGWMDGVARLLEGCPWVPETTWTNLCF